MIKQLIKNIVINNDFLYFMYKSTFHGKGDAIEREVLKKLENISSNNIEDLGKLSETSLRDFLKYCKENVPFYSNKIKEDFLTEFKNLPVMKKIEIRNNQKELISKSFNIKDLVLRNTGGSTGEPFEFYSDKLAGFYDNAHHWYLYSLMGYEKGDFIVSCGGFELHESVRNKGVYWKKNRKGFVFGDYAFSALYITDDNIKDYVNKLLSLKPKILRGYPSFFDRIATFILQNDIDVNFNIKGINLTAEMCSLSQRINIENAFSSRVYFEYGHTEIATFCYTYDDTYIYRSSPIYGYVEVLDDKGEDVPEGGVGKIVVTGFNNIGMPFIRYDTGDLGEVLQRNKGYVEFKSIYGRTQDFLLTKDLHKIYLTALIFGQHLHAFKNIIKWQLIQNLPGKVTIKIVKCEHYSYNDELEIKSNFLKVADFDLTFEYVGTIPTTIRGKHLFLIQNTLSN